MMVSPGMVLQEVGRASMTNRRKGEVSMAMGNPPEGVARSRPPPNESPAHSNLSGINRPYFVSAGGNDPTSH